MVLVRPRLHGADLCVPLLDRLLYLGQPGCLAPPLLQAIATLIDMVKMTHALTLTFPLTRAWIKHRCTPRGLAPDLTCNNRFVWRLEHLRQRLQLSRCLRQLLLRRFEVDGLVLQLLRQAGDLCAQPLLVLPRCALCWQVGPAPSRTGRASARVRVGSREGQSLCPLHLCVRYNSLKVATSNTGN